MVCASRRPGESWLALEQPERERAALATMGEAVRLRAEGGERFASLADRWRRLAAAAVGGERAGIGHGESGGLVAVCGFAFAPDGGRSPEWADFEPASLIVPEVGSVGTLRRRTRPARAGSGASGCASR